METRALSPSISTRTVCREDLPASRARLVNSVETPTRAELKTLVDSLVEKRVDLREYGRIVYLCGEHRALAEGKRVHMHLLQNRVQLDLVLGINIIRMYFRCGCLGEARKTLDTMVKRDVILWTEVIAEHSKFGHFDEALKLFRQMQLDGVSPNKITFLTILNACKSVEALAEVHARVVEYGAESNPMVATTLIHKYGDWGLWSTARGIFDRVSSPDIFVYNVMITAYEKSELFTDALQLFHRVLMEGFTPDSITFLGVLSCCQSDQALPIAKLLHKLVREAGLESELEISTGLVSMYSKCGSLEDAIDVFRRTTIHNRDVVLYSAIAGAHARLGSCRECLELVAAMHQEGIRPCKITFSAIFDAAAGRATRDEIGLLSRSVFHTGLEADVDVATALIHLYGKGGQLDDARMIFDRMKKRTVVSWTTIISSYAQQGRVPEVLELFREMQLAGFVPSLVTYLSVLAACSHGGLLAEAHSNFVAMIQDYGLRPSTPHHGCMVDLLGRSGQVDDADEFLKKMPEEPDHLSWMTLLGACRNRGDRDVGRNAGKRVLQLDPSFESGYVVLSSVYAGGVVPLELSSSGT